MRQLGLAVGTIVLGLSACSLLLDTESLQKGKSPAATGAGGSGGGGGTGGAGGSTADAAPQDGAPSSAGKACTSDTDCLPSLDIDGCTVYACAASADASDSGMTCQPPKSNSGGFGIVSAGTVESILSADDIGYPSVLVDGTDIVMAVWHKNAGATDVLIRKYPAYPQGGVGAELSAIAPGMFRSYASSPGMITRPAIPRKVRLLLAADRVSDAAVNVAVHQLDIDVPSLNNTLKLSAMQPTVTDVGVGGYDPKPRVFPPRLLLNGTLEPAGMWVQQQKLYYFDGTTAAEAYSAKHVLGFIPLAGPGVHAALLTSDVSAAAGVEKTELWSQGNTALVSLDGDQAAPRRGLSATSTNESGTTANLVAWAFDAKGGSPETHYTGAVCTAQSCASIAFSSDDSTVPYAAFPELSSARETGSMIDRDVVQAFQAAVPDPTQANMSTTVLFGGASRVTFPTADISKSTTKSANPTVFPIDAVSGLSSSQAGNVIGPVSVANTSDGQMLVAWVVRPETGPVLLRARRYTVKACP